MYGNRSHIDCREGVSQKSQDDNQSIFESRDGVWYLDLIVIHREFCALYCDALERGWCALELLNAELVSYSSNVIAVMVGGKSRRIPNNAN